MQGILMTPENHKAIREKRKTITRKLDHLKEINKTPDRWCEPFVDTSGHSWLFIPKVHTGGIIVKPRYRVGETIYIKEAWWEDSEGDIYYKTDWTDRNGIASQPKNGRWKSPLFMPAWAARDFIKITDVRPERLQAITLEDCKAEGIHGYTFARGCLSENPPDPRWAFIELWDSINKAYPFDGNWWVWRICFNLIEDKR